MMRQNKKNEFDINAFFSNNPPEYLGLFYQETQIGYVHQDRLGSLQKFPQLFSMGCSPLDPNKKAIYFSQSFVDLTFNEKNKIIQEFCVYLHEQRLITGWRNELYPVFKQPIARKILLFVIERSCIGYLGFPGYGTHINGYVLSSNPSMVFQAQTNLNVWVAKRSQSRSIDPGKLDQMVAGGLPYGLSHFENMKKECFEEANISEMVSSGAQYVHTLRYWSEDERGAKYDISYVYDLQLAPSFIPYSNDQEVELFELMSIPEIEKLIREGHFKRNSGLMMLDFIIRHLNLANLPVLRNNHTVINQKLISLVKQLTL